MYSDEIEARKASNLSSVRPQGTLDLNPVEFLCQFHDQITERGMNLLAHKHHQNYDASMRAQLYEEDYQDFADMLRLNGWIPRDGDLKKYIDIIFADFFGEGVLEVLLKDPDVDEIVVAAHDKVYAEIHGALVLTPIRFPSVNNALNIVKRIINPLNRRLDASTPNVDAQLPDGSRLSASIAPLRANNEISINIRKFSKQVEPLSYYVEKYGAQTPEMARFLEDCVRVKASMIVSGGTGSGKTTLLNSLSIAIPEEERIITVEDTLELQLQQEDVESYQTIEPGMDGKGGFSMQQVIIATLRKRPDRIIVGECRGPEIVEMLNAMNTGHEGSLSTIHANSPEEMLMRCSTMIRSNPSSAHLSERSISDMLSTISMIVQTQRLPDGSRKIMNITEVAGVGQQGYERLKAKGFTPEGSVQEDRLYVQDIFRFVQTGRDQNGKIHGVFEATGYVPYVLDKLVQNGLSYEASFFEQRILQTV